MGSSHKQSEMSDSTEPKEVQAVEAPVSENTAVESAKPQAAKPVPPPLPPRPRKRSRDELNDDITTGDEETSSHPIQSKKQKSDSPRDGDALSNGSEVVATIDSSKADEESSGTAKETNEDADSEINSKSNIEAEIKGELNGENAQSDSQTIDTKDKAIDTLDEPIVPSTEDSQAKVNQDAEDTEQIETNDEANDVEQPKETEDLKTTSQDTVEDRKDTQSFDADADTEEQSKIDNVNDKKEPIAVGEETSSTTNDKEEDDKEEDPNPPKAVFGSGTAFGSRPSSSSSINVFGSGTSFGSKSFSGVSVFGSGSVSKNDESLSNAESSSPASAAAEDKPVTSVFGSGTSFGSNSIFGSRSKLREESSRSTSIFDRPDTADSIHNSDEDDTTNDGSEARDESQDQLFVKVPAPLEQKHIETGEESEDSVFSCRARLYALNLTNSASGWKERGVGTLHVNKERDNKKARIVMRADSVFRVILNLPLLPTSEVLEGMKSSMVSEKFVRVTGFEGETPFQFAIKAGNKDLAKTLLTTIQTLIKELGQ
ncbi:Yrb2p [Sugiyamaella lignohabitans]|uniref:Yrb2p n=1 Tax=Sugiyamaella lignohabitans TaxID=796027 RepID=A0A167F769_9ASCO|nr:Yrb2p [Sugiyamaella lignohabitans]ANB14898.1 Yrb2p [Sugiyamaella lignohabitans]